MRLLFLLLFALPAMAQPVLDGGAVPGLTEEGRAAYASFLRTNLPRAFAIGGPGGGPGGGMGAYGWSGGSASAVVAQHSALDDCAKRGATDCRLYATDLSVVGQPPPPLPPGALQSTWNYSVDPDIRYIWRGPAAAAGVYVWCHGTSGDVDSRGKQPQPHVRQFNNAGYDVVRFDRDPIADRDRVRAAGWLVDTLTDLRARGYRRIVVGGQSRGAWTALMMLATPGLADVVIAVSPAAHGSGGSTNLSAQYDDLRQLVSGVRPARTRVAFVQFAADPFAGDLDGRRALIERLRPTVGGLLMIDQPPGFTGHYGGNSVHFAEQFGPCLLRFATGGADHC